MICSHCQRENPDSARFCSHCGHSLLAGESSAAAGGLDRFLPTELAARLQSARAAGAMLGERRVVTMLFCDVTGSSAAAEGLDPEEWTEIINGAFEFMIPPVYKYEGTVARLMGDGILAFFGAPIAHEDDPERAVLAGLEIVAGMGDYQARTLQEWGLALDVRVGINTGLVVVGAVGSDMRMEYTAIGDAINLAARMEQSADPGTVRIAEETYMRVESLFDVEALGGIAVKGKTEPVPAYRVLGRRAGGRAPRGIAGLEAPLVGRDSEKAALESAFERLAGGQGGSVFLLGEAGLGKSRLLQEARRSNPDLAWFETHSLSYEFGQPYGLFQRLIRRMASARENEGEKILRTKIAALVREANLDEAWQAQRVFESLFGLAGSDGRPPLEGESFRGLLYTTMFAFWEGKAHAGPVVVVCDDLHWADPASAALLKALYPLTGRGALLLLCALRPDRESPGWGSLEAAQGAYPDRFHEIRLQPLDPSQSGALVDCLLKAIDFPGNLRDMILEKSEGNPYFVEEVVRTLIEREILVSDAGGGWQVSGSVEDLDLPGSLQALLVARIDRLPEPARRTLQAASVVGRSFQPRVLQEILDFETRDLHSHLGTLLQTQLIAESDEQPDPEFLFQHALTQEAAYGTILLKQRRAYHRQVGEALERLFPERRDELAARLADHFERGRVFDKALDGYVRAGDAAYRLHAVDEAVTHYDRALALVQKVGVESGPLVHLYTRRGRALELGSHFEAALANYRELAEAGEARNDDSLRLASLTARCILRATQTPLYDPPHARELAQQALTLARVLGDRTTEARVLWGKLLVEAWGDGDNHKALEYGLHSLELARELGLKDQQGFTYTNLVNVYLNLDRLGYAREANRQAEAIWEETGNLPMLADAHTMKQVLLIIAGNFDQAVEIARQSHQLSRSIGNTWNQITSLFYLTTALFELGEVRQADQRSQQLWALIREHGLEKILNSVIREKLARYLATGLLDKAEQLADELYKTRAEYISIFRIVMMANAIRTKLRCRKLAQAKAIRETILEEMDPEKMPVVFKSDFMLAEIEIMLEEGDFHNALARLPDLVTTLQRIEYGLFLPLAFRLQAKALFGQDRLSEAAACLREGLAVSRGNGERWQRWQILADMAAVEERAGNSEKAQAFLKESAEAVSWIAGRSPEDQRVSFLNQPEVRRILAQTS